MVIAINLDALADADIVLLRHLQRIALAAYADNARLADAVAVAGRTDIDRFADVDNLVFVAAFAVRRAAFRAVQHVLLDIRQRTVTRTDGRSVVAALREYGSHRAVKLGIDLLRLQRKKCVARRRLVPDLRGIVADYPAVRRKDGLGFACFDAARRF